MKKFLLNAVSAINFLNKSCKDGRFASTQATLLSLKAIVEYDAVSGIGRAEGSIIARLNGEEVSSEGFDKKVTGTIEFPAFDKKIKSGNFILELEMLEGFKMPYSIALRFYVLKGSSSSQCSVDLKTSLANTKLKEGEGSEINVVVENVTDKMQPMTVCIVGLPGGLEPRHQQLKELVKSNAVDFYETLGARKVVLYWRAIKAKEKKSFKIDVIASFPGTYTGPASTAYLYYTDEDKVWVDGLTVNISPK